MPKDIRLQITIDPNLLGHFREHLEKRHSKAAPEESIAKLVASILDDSAFPLEAKLSDKRTIHLAYHLRSFSQPIFED